MSDPPDIILIVLDTMRVQTFSEQICNANAFKQLAKDGVMYNLAISPSSWTIPSHASIFTGLYPTEHRVHKYPNRSALDFSSLHLKTQNTLPAIVRKLGYVTKSLHSNILLSKGSGFDFGFDICESVGPFASILEKMTKIVGSYEDYRNLSPLNQMKKILINEGLFSVKEVAKANFLLRRELMASGFPKKKGSDKIVSRYLDIDRGSTQFTFLNFMESHEPYGKIPSTVVGMKWKDDFIGIKEIVGTSKIKRKVVETSKRAYSRSVIVMDDQVRQIISELKRISQYDKTLIIVTSDHGQSLMEDGYFGHGIFLHDHLINVPLLIKYPESFKVQVNGGYHSIVDLYNFIVDWASGIQRSFPSREIVFSEEFGMFKGELGSLTKNKVRKHPAIAERKAILMNNTKMVVNGETGLIEEFSQNGRPQPIERNLQKVKEMIGELEIFIGSNKFRLPNI